MHDAAVMQKCHPISDLNCCLYNPGHVGPACQPIALAELAACNGILRDVGDIHSIAFLSRPKALECSYSAGDLILIYCLQAANDPSQMHMLIPILIHCPT